MPRSLSPVVLPGDPTTSLQAGTKQYIDAGLALKINTSTLGAVSGTASLDSSGKLPSGQLTVHTHSAYEATANKGAASGYAGLDSGGLISLTQMPVTATAVRAATVSSSYTADLSSGGWYFNLTITANATIGAPTTPSDNQVAKFACLASGGTWTVTFASGIVLSTGLIAVNSVPSGKVLLAAMQYTSLISSWVLTAVTVSA